MYSPCNRVSTTYIFVKPQEEYHITITYIYKNIDGVKRIRFSSPHPQDVDDEMLEVMSSHKNICNHNYIDYQIMTLQI